MPTTRRSCIDVGSNTTRLAFLGATRALGAGGADGTIAVVDVGGGSTELAIGPTGGEVGWWASLAVGSSVLAGAHSDPPRVEELDRAGAQVAEAFEGVEAPRAALARRFELDPERAHHLGGR